MKKIKVETMPNGYSLDIDNNSYFYHNALGLMEGVMFHIGLNISTSYTKETIQAMLTAAMNWNENSKAVAEIKRLNAEITNMKYKVKSSEEQVRKAKWRIDTIISRLTLALDKKSKTVLTLSAAVKDIISSFSNQKQDDEKGEDKEC